MSRPRRPPEETRGEVARLLSEGHSKSEIARRLGVRKPTVTYHVRQLGLPVDDRAARRYDWAAVQAYYDRGFSISDCQERFAISRWSLVMAARRGDLLTRPHAMSIEELLGSRARSRSHIKGRLIRAGLLEARCYGCGLVDWQSAPIALQLHHVNGDGADNRVVISGG